LGLRLGGGTEDEEVSSSTVPGVDVSALSGQ
jgi:hypothetical protein